MPIKWLFPELLERERVSIYRLYTKVADRGVSRTSLYNWGKRAPKMLDLDMAERVLSGLSEITHKNYQLSDLVILDSGDV